MLILIIVYCYHCFSYIIVFLYYCFNHQNQTLAQVLYPAVQCGAHLGQILCRLYLVLFALLFPQFPQPIVNVSCIVQFSQFFNLIVEIVVTFPPFQTLTLSCAPCIVSSMSVESQLVLCFNGTSFTQNYPFLYSILNYQSNQCFMCHCCKGNKLILQCCDNNVWWRRTSVNKK